uniref:Secreted protein n=1 Tax=Caenorhabditis tropicalis TaxID=1561998 RepID=A0A1I7TXL5_9PELO
MNIEFRVGDFSWGVVDFFACLCVVFRKYASMSTTRKGAEPTSLFSMALSRRNGKKNKVVIKLSCIYFMCSKTDTFFHFGLPTSQKRKL